MLRSILISFLYGAILTASAALADDTSFGWAGLYNEEMIAWMENQNNLDALCPQSLLPADRNRCREEKLKPGVWSIEVHEKPSSSSPKMGSITITFTPGSGLTFAYRGSGILLPFTPDLYDSDWGYGPYFHQTFLENRASWFLLPKDPLPAPGWIDISQLTRAPDVRKITEGQVYTLSDSSIVVIKIDKQTVTVRPEQPADMWCDAGEPPKLQPFQKKVVPVSELFDRNRHLKLKIKYTRGC